jgi:hypothetical protein
LEWRCGGITKDAASGGKKNRIFDGEEWNAAVMKLGGQAAIIAANNAGSARDAAVRIEDGANVLGFRH